MIQVSVDDDRGLAFFSVRGLISIDDYCLQISDHFKRHHTPDTIWDLTEANLTNLNTDGFKQIIEVVRVAAQVRGPNPRTVFITDKTQEAS